MRSLCATVSVFSLDQLLGAAAFSVQFVNVAREAGLRAKTIFGAKRRNKFLLETTGCGRAFGDFDNDGDMNCINDAPQLVRCDQSTKNNWVKIKTAGVKPNRSGSYLSQSGLRVHFGIGQAESSIVSGRPPTRWLP